MVAGNLFGLLGDYWHQARHAVVLPRAAVVPRAAQHSRVTRRAVSYDGGRGRCRLGTARARFAVGVSEHSVCACVCARAGMCATLRARARWGVCRANGTEITIVLFSARRAAPRYTIRVTRATGGARAARRATARAARATQRTVAHGTGTLRTTAATTGTCPTTRLLDDDPIKTQSPARERKGTCPTNGRRVQRRWRREGGRGATARPPPTRRRRRRRWRRSGAQAAARRRRFAVAAEQRACLESAGFRMFCLFIEPAYGAPKHAPSTPPQCNRLRTPQRPPTITVQATRFVLFFCFVAARQQKFTTHRRSHQPPARCGC